MPWQEMEVALATLSEQLRGIDARLSKIEDSPLRQELLERITRTETEVAEVRQDIEIMSASISSMRSLDALAKLLGPKRIVAAVAGVVMFLGVVQIVINKVMS